MRARAVSPTTSILRDSMPARSFNSYSSARRACKTLEIPAVPEDVRLFLDLDAAAHAMADQQRLADQLQHLAAPSGCAALLRKPRGQRIDHIENAARLRVRHAPAPRSWRARRR